MGTSYQEIYSAFQSMILEDEWAAWEEEDIETDFRLLLEQAIPYFKFPRTSLERNDEGFTNTLNTVEIQILASYMKIAWLNRCILTWQHLKPLYSEADFSQANLIDKFTKLLAAERTNTVYLENLYYRSIDGKPFNYRVLGEQS